MKHQTLKEAALAYHRASPKGKIGIVATKPLVTQHDLSLAYSPGVAEACLAIVEDSKQAQEVTARANLVGVISNGTAVLGLGNIGALAAKPVMEGKAVLFKKFAGIDVFDLEIDEPDIDRFCNAVRALEPTFGGINLEDIKSPECFEIEKRLKEEMSIPVFHDDQHGTAIIVASAFMNAMHLQNKKPEQVKLVCSGAGAAALACLDILVELGVNRKNIIVLDIDGVIYSDRKKSMDPYKVRYATKTAIRTMDDAIEGADIFLGLSAPKVLSGAQVKKMAPSPLIMALANPEPEIRPEEVRKVRNDAICATGRSDYPNQVNNVLCFPFLFRGALDVGASVINMEMKIAAAKAIALLARKEAAAELKNAYNEQERKFGPGYIIPSPFDPRLILEIAPAVAQAAIESKVARNPIGDMDAYRNDLGYYVYRSGAALRPLFDRAKNNPRRVVYADGEDERVLRAVQVVVDEGIAFPILIGRRVVVASRIERYGLRLVLDEDVELCDPESDPRYKEYWKLYHHLCARKGASVDYAKAAVRTRAFVIACLMLYKGEADAALGGLVGQYKRYVRDVRDIIGCMDGLRGLYAMNMLILESGTIFIADTHVINNPEPDQLAEMVYLATQKVKEFGLDPKVALLSHSNFGSDANNDSERMCKAVELIHQKYPDIAVEGEMQADTALDQNLRGQFLTKGRLNGSANLLIMPNLDAANIAYNMVKILADGQPVGPIMLGAKRPIHIMTTAATSRSIINLTAIVVDDANRLMKVDSIKTAKGIKVT